MFTIASRNDILVQLEEPHSGPLLANQRQVGSPSPVPGLLELPLLLLLEECRVFDIDAMYSYALSIIPSTV